MAECYVDPASGVDSTGRGSEALPYASIQYADTDSANWADGAASTFEGNTIWLANTSADVLSSTIALTINAAEAPLRIAPYDAGGSLTCVVSRGRSIMCGEIDGNDAAVSIFNNENSVFIEGLYCHSTTGYCLYINYCTMRDCRVVNGAASRPVFMNLYGHAYGCYIENNGANNSGVYYGMWASSETVDCEVVGGYYGLYISGQYSVHRFNLVRGFTFLGVYALSDFTRFYKNTVDGTDIAYSNGYGIYSGAATIENQRVHDNIVANVDGTGGKGIYVAAGSPFLFLGNNAFYNNTTDTDINAGVARSAANITESSDPFTNRATGDYTLTTGTNSEGAALTQFLNRQGCDDDIGAFQLDPPGPVPPTVAKGGFL